MRAPNPNQVMAAVLALAATALLGACTGSGGKTSAGASDQAAGRTAQASSVASAAAPSAARAAPAAGDAAALLAPARIRTADLTVSVPRAASVSARADTARAVAVAAGGDVDADERSGGAHGSATLVLRVPPQQLESVLDSLGRRLGQVRSRHMSTEDVTAKVADVTSRTTSAQQAITRLRQLYTHASKVTDVIRIESELSTRESDLESLQAQQRALSRQTSMAVVTVTLDGAPATVVRNHRTHRTGFVGGLHNGWDAFTGVIGAFVTALGAALPFLLLALVIGVAARLVWRRRRPRPVPTAD